MKTQDSRSNSNLPLIVLGAAVLLALGAAVAGMTWLTAAQAKARSQAEHELWLQAIRRQSAHSMVHRTASGAELQVLGTTPLRVVDKDGQPVVGALVRVVRAPKFIPRGNGRRSSLSSSVLNQFDLGESEPLTTGANGRVDVPYTAGGLRVNVTAQDPHLFGSLELEAAVRTNRTGGTLTFEEVNVDLAGRQIYRRPDEELAPLTLVVEPAHEHVFRFEDEAGQVAANVPILLGWADPSSRGYLESWKRTTATGEFVMLHCVEDPLDMDGGVPCIGLDRMDRTDRTEPSQSVSLEPIEHPAPNRVQVVKVADLSSAGAIEVAFDDEVSIVFKLSGPSSGSWSIMLDDGNIVGGLPRGVVLTLTPRHPAFKPMTFTIPESATAPLRVEVPFEEAIRMGAPKDAQAESKASKKGE